MKCVLVGYGYWGKILERYIKESSFFKLSGIYDPLLEDKLEMTEILTDKSIKCAFVCNPIDEHYSTVKLLLEHGKHVFCEKPLSKNLEESMELLNLAKKNNLTLFTDYIYTVSPSINEIKKKVTVLGKVLYCEGNIKQFGKFYQNDDVFEVLGVHMLSAISYIFNSEIKIINIISKKKNFQGIVEIGSVEFQIEEIKGIINCSLLEEKKERKIIFICEYGNIIFDMLGIPTVSIVKHNELENGYNNKIIESKVYDEKNNISISLKSFEEHINNKSSNDIITLNVAKAVEFIKNLI